ncbi:MAG: hypothetical protein ABIH42_02495 [Planctomycetota bacterium]
MRKILLTLLFVFVIAFPVYALEVKDMKWGFDGKVITERVNVLSVLITNPTDMPFEGFISLYRADFLGRVIGVKSVQPCYISPFSEKWVQFYIYLGFDAENEKWAVIWGDGIRDSVTTPDVKFGPPARVFLYNSAEVLQTRISMKMFSEDIFPTTVCATDGLYSVVLDHCPKWEPVRREAFMKWVYRGGVVHILHDSSGKYPKFTAELVELNNPLEQFRIGSGIVTRHNITHHKVSEALFERMGFTAPVLNRSNTNYLYYNNIPQNFFSMMKNMVKPRYDWSLIGVMIFCYIVLICPVNFFLARRKGRRYWTATIFLLATVITFSFILYFLGRRGYGEVSKIHTVSYARLIKNDLYDVTQYTNVFVTDGDYYTLTHSSPHNIYSLCEKEETINGIIVNGRDGYFKVDIPLYSSRAFIHTGELKGDNIRLKVIKWNDKGIYPEIVLSAAGDFPDGILEAWLLYKNSIYQIGRNANEFKVIGESAKNIESFIESLEKYYYTYRNYPIASANKIYSAFANILIARSVGGTSKMNYYLSLCDPSCLDRAQVFIYMRTPESFKLVREGLGEEKGYVLYHQFIDKPE